MRGYSKTKQLAEDGPPRISGKVHGGSMIAPAADEMMECLGELLYGAVQIQQATANARRAYGLLTSYRRENLRRGHFSSRLFHQVACQLGLAARIELVEPGEWEQWAAEEMERQRVLRELQRENGR